MSSAPAVLNDVTDVTVTTADYGTVVTAAGSAKIAACILNGTKLNITHAAVGDGGGAYYKPTAEQEALLQECWRGEIARYEINATNPNMLDIEFVVPAEVGGFTIREAALFDADGVMVAVCNTPDAQKVNITDGVSFPVKMVMHIIVTDVSAVNVVVNSALDTISREEMNAALNELAAEMGSTVILDIVIPAAGWVEIQEPEAIIDGYGYVIDVAVEEALELHFPSMALARESLRPAASAGLCPTIETLDGIVRFWAKRLPDSDLTGTIQLRSASLRDSGYVPGDVATDEEVDDTIDDIFGQEGSAVAPGSGVVIATDEEVQETLDEIFK